MAVGISFARYFVVDSCVNPGHLLQKPAFMALSHVVIAGLPAALCRYSAMSLFLCNS